MLLKSLKLKNIRSYTDQTINFPENSTLLSGDIGSGKSTLLLAIEFALFGICKPDLTGETLLRKGTTSASVELSFQLEGKEISIQRNLKKTKDSISQTAGWLVVNDLRKDLTPVELKSEIINHLNYPEEFISKSKNYIFRYTIYCPQEEMKQILQEHPDNRLDILRKIFNLDKYKKIRENLYLYLKKLRIQSTVLKTRVEPLDQKKTNLTELRKQQEQFQVSLNQLLPELHKTTTEIKNQKEKLLDAEQKNQLHLEIKNQLNNNHNLLKEKQDLQTNFLAKQKQLILELAQIIIPETKEKIKQDLDLLQKQKQEFLTKESELKTKIDNCQEKVAILQKEISHLIEQTKDALNTESLIKKLHQELFEKEKIKTRKEQNEIELQQTNKKLHENQMLLSQTQQIKKKISQLDICPTCLQAVPEEYKLGVFSKQEQIIQKININLEKIEQEKNELQHKAINLNQHYDSLLKKENLLIKTQTEFNNLLEKQENLKLKKEQLQKLVIENNYLIKSLEELKPDIFQALNHALSEKQELLQKIVQKQELKKNQLDLLKQIEENKEKEENLKQTKENLEKKLALNPELTNQINQSKQIMEELLETEKKFLEKKTKLNTQTENLQIQLTQLIKEVDKLSELKTHLKKITQICYWSNEFLIKLTYTIEKQVMVKIHYLFNSLFQEWFSILMEDENFSARLDDSFTPIIEQNGYEIYFNNLSGGERTAASLSYRLALNKVINDVVYNIKTKDLLILDEPTDGFSSEQLDKVRDILERLNLKQTLIVSHESKIESFVDNVIRINKSEGNSTIF